MIIRGVSDRTPKALIRRIDVKVKETKVKTMDHEGHYVRDGNYNRDNNFNWCNYGHRNCWSGPYVQRQNREVFPRDGGASMVRVKDKMHKLMRRFDASD